MTKKRSLVPTSAANVVIDLSHHNADPDFGLAHDTDGIVDVIHKATQGLTYTDPTLAEREANTRAAE